MMCFFLQFFFFLLTQFPSYTFSLCSHDDSYALLQFKNSFVVTPPEQWSHCLPSPSKIESWNNGTDCCEWDGVTCNNISGHVIGLDLSCSHLKGKFSPNSTIFHLKQLQQLNLAFNDFYEPSIYYGIGDLVNLTHLNLSYSGFIGNVPSTISHLSKIISLDLSGSVRLDPFTWKGLILNGTNLRQLHLDGVDMSSIIGSSLSRLINVSSSLVSLRLSSTGLHGKFPTNILSFPNLEELDLSSNQNLSGQLPMSNWSTPLRYLDLSYTAFLGGIPHSIGQLKSLTQLDLTECNFDGLVPPPMWNLTQLKMLSLAGNNFYGEISSLLSNLSHLTYLDLSNNGITGTIPESLSNLRNLEWLDLSRNQLRGEIPVALTKLHSLHFLNLSQNLLEGTIPGGQFATFGNYSYEGNAMLCGYPLSKSCRNDEDQSQYSTSNDDEESEFGWKAIVIGYGCGSILGMLVGYSVFFNGKPQGLIRFFEHIFNIRLKRKQNIAGANGRRMN